MFEPRYYRNFGLEEIARKVCDRERLTIADGEKLFACPDLNAVGSLAHEVRKRLYGNQAYYVVNRHINYSNICVNGCRFCAFSKKKGDPLSFELSEEQILEKIGANGHDLTEIHVVGGCHPDLPLSFFEGLIGKIRELQPHAFIKAFTAVEVAHFAKKEGIAIAQVLARLKAAGVKMMPGGGAEIFSDRVRSLLCPEKLDARGWLDCIRQAHEMGIKTNATMLYGHIETRLERLEHLVALRELQDRTGGFVCFIPLSFQTANTPLGAMEPPTGVEDLKTIAISRLMLDNIPHIKAYWVMLSAKVAQVALYFGADDFDGTVVEEKIGHMAGAKSRQEMTRSEIEGIIRDGGFLPVERDSLFRKAGRDFLETVDSKV
ncbi:MAG: aminofutalosine synthase MqnE [Syntrophobacteraceae bacterium]|nr:aminofutalosine synthase MqnE [Syntrophobacteraceae bacterium]